MDKHGLIGSVGFLASIGLSEWNAVASLAAACLTCIYMALKIYQTHIKK